MGDPSKHPTSIDGLVTLDGSAAVGSTPRRHVRRLRLLGCLVAAALTLAACSATDGDSEGTDGSLASTDDPLVAALTESQREMHEAALQSMADFWGVDDPPEYPVTRWVLVEEADDIRADCMAGLGYERSESGSYDTGGQSEAFGAAQYECIARYPQDPQYLLWWEEEQYRAQYEWVVQVLIPCLEEQGHPITDVPSRDVFIEQYETAPFYPFGQIPQPDFARVEAACPPEQAPTTVLFDGVAPLDHELADY